MKGGSKEPLAQPKVKETCRKLSCLSMVAPVGVEMRLTQAFPSIVNISPPVLNSKWDFHLTWRIAYASVFSMAVAVLRSLNYCVLDIGIQEVILEQLEGYPGHPRTMIQFAGNLAEEAPALVNTAVT